MTQTLDLAGTPVSLDQLPALLAELDLLPLLLRRHLERSHSSAYLPTRDEQIAFQQTFLARERISDQASLTSWLQRQGISEPQMSQRLFRALQLEQFKQATFGPRVEPLFLERKAALDRVTYSLLRVRERAKAVELHLRLEEEEATFADLASTYSEGVEQQFNGLIGPMELGRINPVLAERLRISTPGQLWPPFAAEGWWVLLRHERHLPAQLDDAMQQRLLNEMYELWMREQVAAGLAQLQPPSTASAETPAPSTELPQADALQPTPDPAAPPEARRGLFKTLLGLG
ncbi:MAG: peptidylprolyl isomerase [Cyanobacteriota bacterium]|nr:peptidylprolyl isomerase [Cyanobacteriota bacterium]